MIFGINTTRDISKLSQISYNNFEISLVVFMPNITTNHAIGYTNWTPLSPVTTTYYYHYFSSSSFSLLLSSFGSSFVSTKNQTQTQITNDKLRSETSLSSRCGLKRELVKTLTFPAQHYRRFINWTVHLKSLFGIHVPRKIALPRTLNGHG